MNTVTLISLRDEAINKFNELSKTRDDAITEISRVQGDYRTLDRLINQFKDEVVNEIVKSKITKKGK